MEKKFKFKLKNGKSTGYAFAYFVAGEHWYIIRCMTKDEAKGAMRDAIRNLDIIDCAILHVEDSWQRRYFDDEAL